MASDDTKTKASPAPKKEAAPAEKSPAAAEPAKVEASPKADAAPAGYSRGEGQKPVTQAYKDNWNLIFGKKAKTKKR